jgi:hypothetical protein
MCISLFRQRKKKDLDEDLPRAAYCLKSFGQVGFKPHAENSADAGVLNLHDNDLLPLDGNEIYPILQDRHEELDLEEGAEIPDMSASDDDGKEREEEELSEGQPEIGVLFNRMTDCTEDPDDLGLRDFLITDLTQSMENDGDVRLDKINSAVARRLIDLFYRSAGGMKWSRMYCPEFPN